MGAVVTGRRPGRDIKGKRRQVSSFERAEWQRTPEPCNWQSRGSPDADVAASSTADEAQGYRHQLLHYSSAAPCTHTPDHPFTDLEGSFSLCFFLSFISKNWENVQAVIEKPRNRGEPRHRRQSKLASPAGATAGASARRQGSARSASTAPPCRRPRTHSAPPPAPRGPRHRCRCSVTVAF